MNCRERHHDIILFLYNELDEQKRNGLREHLDRCETCREFHEREKSLYSLLTEDFSAWEVPADLLVECRRDLAENLDRASRRWWRWQAPVFPRLRLLESAALLSIGLALGVWFTNHRSTTLETALQASLTPSIIPDDAAVSNLRIIESNPVSGQVELAGEVVRTMRLEGSIQDAPVRELLFSALRSTSNPGMRLRAVELLAHNPRDPNIKDALIGALLGDENPGVRLHALQGLKAFSREPDVRSALIYALENDVNPGIRVEAIEALTPLTREEAMDEVVQEAVRDEPNEYIRMRALQFVGNSR